jgi:hypothetical protein
MMAKLKYTALAILFIGGIALTGSDGAYFPYANLAGFGILYFLSLIFRRVQ